MNWLEARIETSKEGLDLLCSALEEIGFTGFAIHDPDDFDDLMAQRAGHWDYLEEGLRESILEGAPSVTVYVPRNAQGAEQFSALQSLLKQLQSEHDNFGTLALTTKDLREEDWENSWKAYFHPFELGERLLVAPAWEEPENAQNRVILRVDPGSSFGTGQHETTRLCLTLLEECVENGAKVLDLGCGSGILSIAAILLGAKSALAVDIEENAVKAALDNAALNGIDMENYTALRGDILKDSALVKKIGGGYDIVAANIVADVLIAMGGLFGGFLAPRGVLLLSGIIEARAEEVQEAMARQGFALEEARADGGWYALKLRRA